MRKLAVSGLALVAAFWLAAPASASSASPDYVSSDPSNGEQVHKAPERVTITFSEPLDPSSEMTVEDHCGRTVDDGDVTISTNEMSVGLELRPAGTYHVSYVAKGFGGITGQEEGMFEFSAHAGPSCDGSDEHEHHGKDDDDEHEGKHRNDEEHEGKHDNDDHEGDDHDEGTHSGGTHSSGTHSGNDHESGSHMSGSHSNGKHKGGHDKHKRHGRGNGNDSPPLASGPAGDIVPPDGRAALIALALSMVVGILGGWILRMSAQR